MGYKTCKHCGANLDPQEKCDCLENPEPTKKELLQALAATLRLTGRGVVDLELVDEEYVKIHFEGGGWKLVNIAADSHIAIIRDVAKNVG